MSGESRKSYLEVYEGHHGFASSSWVPYFSVYDRIFGRFLEKGEPVKLLQVGVRNVGVLEVWKEYLPLGSVIHGVDKSRGGGGADLGEGVFFHSGVASDIDFMEKTFGDIQFDAVADSGLRVCEDVIAVFEYLFPRMSAGGCYVIEGMGASYGEKRGGGSRGEGSAVEYFKGLIDFGVNRHYIEGTGAGGRGSYSSEIAGGISRLSFFDSIVAVDKFGDGGKV